MRSAKPVIRNPDGWNGCGGRGLRVKLAEADDGTLAGMIQYVPIEHSFAEGHDLY